MLIDTHAHLYYDDLLKNIDNILEQAIAAGVEKIIVPAVDMATSRTILALSAKHSMIFAAIGFHPCDVYKIKIDDFTELRDLLKHDKVVAVGETGLDYYWDKSNIKIQKQVFRKQIELALDNKLPVIIHTRDSIKDAIEIIREMKCTELKGQFHCFSGDEKDLECILQFDDFYVSFCGNITYKKYEGRDVITAVPTERLLAETDSPFLPPEPFRGKKNQPAWILKSIEKIAEFKNISIVNLADVIQVNTNSLFYKLI